MKKRFNTFNILIIITLTILLSACSTQETPKHQDVTIGQEYISFNYKLYEMPALREWGHFEITINLIDTTLTGNKAQISFKSTSQIEVREEPIEFTFQDKSENLRIEILPKNLNEPINLLYEGTIKTSDKDIPIQGSLLINRRKQ